jgi:acyl dehydratase
LPTKIGGDLNFIAREMVFEFKRPVFAGDVITCDVTLTEMQDADRFWNVASTWICRNQHGKEVLTGRASGVIRK